METRFERPRTFLARLNAALRTGLTADCMLACPGDGETFNRVYGTPSQLDTSFGKVISALRARGAALPRKYDTKASPLINLSGGSGYQGENPNNPSGMGLVLPASLHGIVAGVTFADAPGAVVAHTPTGVTAAVSGIWQQLPKGTVDQTIQLMKQQVQEMGMTFDVQDLWVILSPGARAETFFIDTKGQALLAGGGSQFIDGGRIQLLSTPVEQQGRTKTYALDLVGLFYDLWRVAGVLTNQIHLDGRNNMTDRDGEGNLVWPSKRAADERGEDGYTSAFMGLVVLAD
ncbi:MAG: hypothetical protein JWP06_835 [Candidatus Saccharibacteria bacterium]|nr:hypothetical protein [Candidatus Saccharibacteria bacterium]